MKQASNKCQPFFQTLCGVVATVFAPSHCWAAGQAILPWDYSLDAMQNVITGPLAHSVILISGIAAMFAFALAADNKLARRFAKTVVGTSIALLAVQLLKYLAP
jgi:type IV secretory pathway VirB2 component (pilin)